MRKESLPMTEHVGMATSREEGGGHRKEEVRPWEGWSRRRREEGQGGVVRILTSYDQNRQENKVHYKE